MFQLILSCGYLHLIFENYLTQMLASSIAASLICGGIQITLLNVPGIQSIERNHFPAQNQTLRSYRVYISPTK